MHRVFVSGAMVFAALCAAHAVVMAEFGDAEGGSAAIGTSAPTPPPTAAPTTELQAYLDSQKPMWIWHHDKSDPFKPPFPELCNGKATKTQELQLGEKGKAPGADSKRIALLFRGEAYRGLSYASIPCYASKSGGTSCDKLPFSCTDEAIAIQNASAKAQLENMVEPWEAAGTLLGEVSLVDFQCASLLRRI